MAFIGEDIFIGDDWFIGAWGSLPAALDATYPDRQGDLWVYRDLDDNVITQLTFGQVLPGNTIAQTIKIQYRGFSPVKVFGFHLLKMERDFYEGNSGSEIDRKTILRWADDFTASPPLAQGNPGLEITQTHWDTGVVTTTQFKTGVGDLPWRNVTYIGHEDGYLSTDDMMTIDLRITAPDDAAKQVLQAGKFHFGLDISFTEVPKDLVQELINEDC